MKWLTVLLKRSYNNAAANGSFSAQLKVTCGSPVSGEDKSLKIVSG